MILCLLNLIIHSTIISPMTKSSIRSPLGLDRFLDSLLEYEKICLKRGVPLTWYKVTIILSVLAPLMMVLWIAFILFC